MKPQIATYHNNDENENSNFKHVQLLPVESEKRNVTLLDKTISIKILPVPTSRTNYTKYEISDDEESDEDDGVEVTDDEGENFSEDNSKENYEDESFEENSDEDGEDEDESITTTTTKRPIKRIKQITSKRPQRRMHSTTSEKPKQQQTQNALSFSHFVNFLKKIQNSFTTRTAKTISDKVQILKKFRDSLIRSINRQIESLWRFNRSPSPLKKSTNLRPEHKRKKSHRIQKRTLGGGHDDGWMEGGGMAFPSAEGALLSISFLTFAVFLIKLVLVSFCNNSHLSFFLI